MPESREIARMARVRMDRHEATRYEAGASTVFDDADGGLRRYGRALRRVLELCDGWEADGPQDDHALTVLIERVRQAIGHEMGLTQAPPAAVRP